MKQHLFAASVITTDAEQIRLAFRNSCSLATPLTRNSSSRAVGRFFILSLLFILFGMVGYTQNNGDVSVDKYGFYILAPNKILTAGETVTLGIAVGSATRPLEKAKAFNLELNLAGASKIPAGADLDFSNSWFDNSTSIANGLVFSATETTLKLQASSAAVKDGHGLLFEITLKANKSGVNANALIQSGGGLITIEDIGFRKIPPTLEEESSLVVYPNPCQDRLYMDWKGRSPTSVQCRDAQGKDVALLSQAQILKGEWDVSNLPKGIYIMVIQFPDQSVETRMLTVE